MARYRREFLGTSAMGTALLAQSAPARKTAAPWPSASTKALLELFGLRVPIFKPVSAR